jgi:tRNA G18 (ribose-2'-O)-methylase SpoU
MVVRRAVEAGWRLTSLLVLPSALDSLLDIAERVASHGGTVLVAERSTFDTVAGFPVHRGVLALAERPPERDARELIRSCRLVVVAEGVNDHENLGSIFRNAAAFGAGAVLLDPTACDPLYRRSIRVSAGHALRMPFARLAPWPDALSTLREAGFVLIALEPGAPNSVEQLGSAVSGEAPARKLAVVVGAEGPGLSRQASSACDHRVAIRMAPGVDSLNVATALAVGLHSLSVLGGGGSR